MTFSSQTSQSPQELTLVLKFLENLAAESKVRSYGEEEENFEKFDATSDTDRNTVYKYSGYGRLSYNKQGCISKNQHK